jgi:tyrosyl-tRNA synthetase
MSFTEFTYQLVQGYDFLFAREKVYVANGGSDQWGNITTGTELVRRLLAESLCFNVSVDTKQMEPSLKTRWEYLADAARTSPYKFTNIG